MTVNAKEIYYQSRRMGECPFYRGEFNFEAEAQTEEAARAAAVLMRDLRPHFPERARARLGLIGKFASGKSTFCRAFIAAHGARADFNENDPVSIFKTKKGLIARCDAGFGSVAVHRHIKARGIDIIEHADDAVEPNFDIVLYLEPGRNCTDRILTVFADDEIAASTPFATFCESLGSLEAA